MDRLDELVALVAIVESDSLAAAGRQLRKSPPTMTRLLDALEQRVGVRLIERTTRRMAPTEAGLRLAEQARSLIAAYGDAVRAVGASPGGGLLRVTAPRVFGRRHVTPVIASFLAAHPAIRIELVLDDRNLDLVAGGIDVAVRIGRLRDSSLIVRRVGEVRDVLVASPSYLAARGTPQSPADLAAHDIIFTASRPRPLEWRFGAAGEHIARLTPRLLVNDVDATLHAARAGRGIARALSYQVAEDLAAHTLVRLLPELEPAPLPVQLVVPSAQHQAAKTRAFLDHAARSLRVLAVIR